VIGLLAALIVRTKEHEEVVAEQKAAKSDTRDLATDTAAAAAVQMPLALLGALFSSPVGQSSILSLARVLGRNVPLVLKLVATGFLFWPQSAEETSDTGADHGGDPRPPRPNGAYRSSELQEVA
jgi:hypothetical protein